MSGEQKSSRHSSRRNRGPVCSRIPGHTPRRGGHRTPGCHNLMHMMLEVVPNGLFTCKVAIETNERKATNVSPKSTRKVKKLMGYGYCCNTEQKNSSKYDLLKAEMVLSVLCFSIEHSAEDLPDVPLVVQEVAAHD